MIAADRCLCPTDKFVIGKRALPDSRPTAGKSQHLIIFLGFGTQKKDRRVAVLSDAPHMSDSRSSPASWYQDDQVKSIFCRSLDCLLAICRLGHLISLAPQKEIDDLPDLRLSSTTKIWEAAGFPCSSIVLVCISLICRFSQPHFLSCICLQYNNFCRLGRKIKKIL